MTHLQLVTEPTTETPSLTAGQLRAALAQVSDDAHIYLIAGDLWALPDGGAFCNLLGTPEVPE